MVIIKNSVHQSMPKHFDNICRVNTYWSTLNYWVPHYMVFHNVFEFWVRLLHELIVSIQLSVLTLTWRPSRSPTLKLTPIVGPYLNHRTQVLVPTSKMGPKCGSLLRRSEPSRDPHLGLIFKVETILGS